MGGLQLEGLAAVIWLSLILITQAQSPCDSVADEEKNDCGYYGIKRLECEYNGCCWAASSRPNVPWCYHTAGGPQTTPPPRTTPRYTTPRPSSHEIEDLRLVGGEGPHEGRLEILYEGQWGTVCDDGFEDGHATENAQVVCRMLGLTGGQAFTDTEFGEGSGEILLDELQCQGHEASISECGHASWGVHNCGHYEDVGISCGEGPTTGGGGGAGGTEGSIRLMGGKGPHEGRVEVFHEGEWGTVCDDGFEDGAMRENSQVICRMLGLSGGVAMVDTEFGAGAGRIWLDGLTCTGSESRLSDCSHIAWGQHDCGHEEDVGVVCDVPAGTIAPTLALQSNASEIGIRLVNGPTPYEGRLEIYHDGQWGTVCDDGFEGSQVQVLKNVQVVCRMLGYSGGEAKVNTEYGAGSGVTWLDDVECDGHESSIADCQHRGWGVENCSHDEDVGIVCDGPQTTPPYAINTNTDLTDSRKMSQIMYNMALADDCLRFNKGKYDFYLCPSKAEMRYSTFLAQQETGGNHRYFSLGNFDENSDETEVTSEFMRLHFKSGHHALCPSVSRQATVELRCADDEPVFSVMEPEPCMYTIHAEINCHIEMYDADVFTDENIVISPRASTRIWLVGRNGRPDTSLMPQGRVQMTFNGQNGTLCDDGFSNSIRAVNNAIVICRQMGYVDGRPTENTFGEGTGSILLDDLHCKGTEEHLMDCAAPGWGVSNCGHHQDVALSCYSYG